MVHLISPEFLMDSVLLQPMALVAKHCLISRLVHTYSITKYAADGWNLTSNTCTNVSVVAGQTASCVITNTKQASISGMKYNDINRNGKKNTNEPGLQGWVIKLMSGNTVIATTITDASGNYSFQNVAPGTYKVRETHQKGWKRTSKKSKGHCNYCWFYCNGC